LIEPLSAIAAALATETMTTALEPYIRRLLDVQETQGQALERLEDSVRAMMEAPWRESRLHLMAAESAGPNHPARRDAELVKATDALFRAYSVHPRPSVARALVAADTATIEAMVGRPNDARTWAARAHSDIVAFLRAEATRVQSQLNQHPSVVERVRHWAIEDESFWDRLLGAKRDVPKTVSSHKDTTRTYEADSARLRRELLELGPDRPPGWQASGDPAGRSWQTPYPVQSVSFHDQDVPTVNAVIDLHRAAARAEDLRAVAMSFGCGDIPAARLEVRVRRRYEARLVYGDYAEQAGVLGTRAPS
jgi:hypothetical protein